MLRSSDTHWRILNDSSVTEGVTWESFVSRTSKHGRDTPYLLLYQRLGQEEQEERLPGEEKLSSVRADNSRHRSDRFYSSSGSASSGVNKRGNDDDDKGAGGCHDNFGQMGGGRFVC